MSLQTALIVDDSKLARITLQRLLEKRNFQVKMAESGIQALELLKQELPDIIFMDHLMPEMDGFEAMKQIKANPSTRHIPVVMCTGKEGADNYDAEAKSIGASATLSKPPELEQLNVVLAEAQSSASMATPAVSAPTATVTSAPAEPAITEADLTSLEHKLTAAIQTAVDMLRQETTSSATAFLEQRTADLQRTISEQIAQETQALRSTIPTDDTIRALVQQEVSNQPIAVSEPNNDARFDQLKSELEQQAQRFETELAALQKSAESQLPQPDLEARNLLDDLKTRVEVQLEQLQGRLDQVSRDLNERVDSTLALAPQSTEVNNRDGLDAEIQRRLDEVERHLSAQQQDLRSLSEAQANAPVIDVRPEWQNALETDIAELRERLSLELTELRDEISRSAPVTDTYQDYSAIEARATEAAVAAVEETLDALLAHKVEQIRNTLTVELKAQARGQKTDADAPQVNPEEIRTLAHNAVSEELDQASEHLVARITEALQQQVEATQQEILAKQEMFEQERTSLRRQIRSLRTNLVMISAGAGLLAAIAFVTAIVN